MNRVRGMTIEQFNNTLDEMRTVYAFKDDTTTLDEFTDLLTRSNRQVCVHTVDMETGVEVVLCKGVDNYGVADT